MPQWEYINAKLYRFEGKWIFNHLLAIQVREHLNNKYQNHIKIFYWWSRSGLIRQWSRIRYSWFKSAKIFLLTDFFLSIFTSELYAILMAFNYICNIQLAIYDFVICVDSKSVLCALKKLNCKMRGDIFYELKYLIHCIMYKGIGDWVLLRTVSLWSLLEWNIRQIS